MGFFILDTAMSETEQCMQQLVVVMYPRETDVRKRAMYCEALQELVRLAKMELWLETERGWQMAKRSLR